MKHILFVDNIYTSADIDECKTQSHNCDANAQCANIIASFTCTCLQGYSGDGVHCSGRVILIIQRMYFKACYYFLTCQNTNQTFCELTAFGRSHCFRRSSVWHSITVNIVTLVVLTELSPPQRLLGVLGNREDWGEWNIKRAGAGEREKESARGTLPLPQGSLCGGESSQRVRSTGLSRKKKG